MIKLIKDGGICSPKGFMAAGVHCGIRKNRTKKDLALVFSSFPSTAAAIYTTNLVKAAPLLVTKKHLKNGAARAIIINSGIANACVKDGIETAFAMTKITANALGLKKEEILVASTGIIGQSLNLTPIQNGMGQLVSELSENGGDNATEAIMTTDTFPKQVAAFFELNGKTITIGGMAKGSGMINPNMATLLGFLTTDAEIDAALLSSSLKAVAQESFNRISIDGDTSTNDMVAILANGQSGVKIESQSESYQKFTACLKEVCVCLAKLLAKDGEGATKLLEVCVRGAKTEKDAIKIADSVINSPLVKTAMFGKDANWGRILCATGYSKAKFAVDKVDIVLKSKDGEIAVCKSGAGLPFCESTAKEVLQSNEIIIDISLNQGNKNATSWGCDLSYDYVKINGDYRT